MRLTVRRVAEDVGSIFIIYLYSSRFRAKSECGSCCRAAAAQLQLLEALDVNARDYCHDYPQDYNDDAEVDVSEVVIHTL